jgi:putative oxidoreductase
MQLVGGVAVALGLNTWVVALLCSASMAYAYAYAYAYFTVHQPDGLLPIQNSARLRPFSASASC